MSNDRRLEWIQANRTKASRSRPVGGVIERLVGQLAERAQGEQVALEAVGEVVDDEFRAHCRVSSDHRGAVVVWVNDASLVYVMRRQWHSALSAALRCPRNGVRFEYGTAGRPLLGGDR